MMHEHTLELSSDCYNSGATPLRAHSGKALPSILPASHPHHSESLLMPATTGTSSERVPFPAGEKPKSSKGIQAHHSWSPRKIVEVSVRVAMLAAIIWFFLEWVGVATPTQKYREYTIDFSSRFMAQGGPSLLNHLPPVIPYAPLDLAIRLGRGNQPGPFDVVLVQDGMRYALASGSANLENHELILRVKMDLSHVPGGESQLGIRRAGGEWRYYKVILQPPVE